MSDAAEHRKAQRARPTRAAEELPARRRRAGFDHSLENRLPVNEAALDRKRFTYRWFNDEPGRIGTYTQQDDWDLVTEDEVGGPVAHFVGYHPDGSPMMARLAKKPLAFHEADQREKMVKLAQDEHEQLHRAPVAENSGDIGKGYVKPDQISLRHGVTRTEPTDGPELADDHDA